MFAKKAQAMVDKYTVRTETDEKIPVVQPPAGGDVYLIARLWAWWPILELEKGKSYRLHLTAMDYQHGFSLQPENINIQVLPGYEHVVTVTPNRAGHLRDRLQRVLRHRPPQDGEQALRGRQVKGRRSHGNYSICSAPARAPGLQFHSSAETLIKANAVAAVVMLLIGGVLAI